MAAVRVTSLLSMDMLRNTFVTTVARFTQLHAPASMALKHAQAFRALLVIADENGNHLGVCHPVADSCSSNGLRPMPNFGSLAIVQAHNEGLEHAVLCSTGSGCCHSCSLKRMCMPVQDVWQEVLRCVSRWELLQQIASGGPTDAHLFAAPAEPVAAVKRRNFFSRAPREGARLLSKLTRIQPAPCRLSAQREQQMSGQMLVGHEVLRCSPHHLYLVMDTSWQPCRQPRLLLLAEAGAGASDMVVAGCFHACPQRRVVVLQQMARWQTASQASMKRRCTTRGAAMGAMLQQMAYLQRMSYRRSMLRS